MKSITRRVMAAAGALAMAGGVLGAAAVPAYAGGADTVAYAAQSDGPFGFVPPIGFTSSPGPTFALDTFASQCTPENVTFLPYPDCAIATPAGKTASSTRAGTRVMLRDR